MKSSTSVAILAAAIIGCAGPSASTMPVQTAKSTTTTVAAVSAPSPAPAPPPDADTIDRFFAALEKGDAASVDQMLDASPSLASSVDKKGHSAFLAALFQESGESFVRPQVNKMLKAVLAKHPKLDPIEAAAAGDQATLEAELAKDPGYVRRVHRIGWTPLHFAAFGGQTATVAWLLAHGAEVDARAKNKFDNTPLQVALLTSQGEVARQLLDRGADVNAKQGEGFTALHEAAVGGDVAIIKMLLDAGVDISVRGGKKSESALDLAVANDHPEAAAYLRSRGAK